MNENFEVSLILLIIFVRSRDEQNFASDDFPNSNSRLLIESKAHLLF